MVEWTDAAALAIGLLTLVFAGLLVLRGSRTPAVWLLAPFVGIIGGFYVLWGVLGFVGLEGPYIFFLGFLQLGTTLALTVAFAVVYPSETLTRRQVWVLAALVPFVLAHLALAIFGFDLVLVDGVPTAFGAWYFPTLLVGAYGATVILLGRRFLAAPAGPYKTQVLWGLLPFLFWAIHDSLGFGVFPALLGGQQSSLVEEFATFGPSAGSVLLYAILLLAAFVVVGVAFRRLLREDAPAERTLVLFAAYAVPVSLVQLFDPGLHLFVDALLVVLLAYGVARHRVVDMDLRLKVGVRRSTVAAAFLAAFFFASEAASTFFSDAIGPYAGLAAAALLVFALAPVRRVADVVAERALPRVQDTAEYLDARKASIYRGALEGLLRDGVVSAKERATLLRLQEDLALDPREANRIESEILARISSA